MLPATAFAQSVFDGSWKTDVTTIDHPAKPVVHVFKDGVQIPELRAETAAQVRRRDQKIEDSPYANSWPSR
jgi:hypothetical protein